MATRSPKVSPISTYDGDVSFSCNTEPQPISTSIKVPKHSATSIRQMRLFSVISASPIMLSAPAINVQFVILHFQMPIPRLVGIVSRNVSRNGKIKSAINKLPSNTKYGIENK